MMPFFFSFLFFARSFPIFISLIHYGRKEACLRAHVQVGGWLQPHAAVAAGVWRAAAVANVCRRRVKSHALNDVKPHMTSTFI